MRRLTDLEAARAKIDLLTGMLAAQGLAKAPVIPDRLSKLTTQQLVLVGALLRAYPRLVRTEALLSLLPARDHVSERDTKQVQVVVSNIRSVLGADCIETRIGQGYRLSPALYCQLYSDGAFS